MLHPERGDDPAAYASRQLPDGNWVLERRPDGACVYLGPGGCTIHGRHPAVCRAFDCAAYYDRHTRAQRRALVAQGLYKREILRAGRERADARFEGRKRDLARLVVERVKARTA